MKTREPLPELPFAPTAYERIFGGEGPRWLNIPAHRPFVDDLAQGLVEALIPIGPEALSDATVLTPTRRGMRSLTEAFVKAASGRATLLPQIRALGDLEEGEPPFEPGELSLDLPPAVSPLRRRFELARLITEQGDLIDRPDMEAGFALDLADALGGFLDSVQIEELEVASRLAHLVDDNLALHWKKSAGLLAVATELWPRRLDELGLVDVNVRRVRLLRGLADLWRDKPPTRPLIAAGSTGTAPATAALLEVIAKAPRGCVVLPGLDQDLEADAFAQVDEAHAQGALKRLLEKAGVDRTAVRLWPGFEAGPQAMAGRSRRRLISEALRPAEATDDWLRQIADLRKEGAASGVDPLAEGLQGLKLVEARDDVAAAELIALALRRTLEAKDRTAALITPDAALARRVAAVLTRWGVSADSSAGQPLASFPVGVLISLMARAAADPLNPVVLLSLIKHRFARLGLADLALAGRARELERHALRGARPRDADQILTRLEKYPESRAVAERLIEAVALAQAPFLGGKASAPGAMRALAEAMEQLALDERGGTGDLWAGPGGESAAGLIAGILRESEALPPVDAETFAQLIEKMVREETVRSGGASHPRLRILGAMEARLVRADLLILAGLEEGVWPRMPPLDPFLSRGMRKALGLPAPERRIGLAAHDFAQGASSRDVLMVVRQRRDGQPAVKSRWIWRLETLARGAGLEIPQDPDLQAAQIALDQPLDPQPDDLKGAERPRPKPPVSVRPRELPVTAVETWVRDPYGVYARYILRLRALDRPDQPFDNRVRGSAIHKAAERFALDWPPATSPPSRAFTRAYMEELTAAGAPDVELVREQALGERAGEWMAEFEKTRRRPGLRVLVERKGRIALDGPMGPFHLTARADRLEVFEGRASVLDFKTGQPPSRAEIKAGYAPQLSLTAAILKEGGFSETDDAPPRPLVPDSLVYVRLTGRDPAAEIIPRDEGDAALLADDALEGLKKLIVRYDNQNQDYTARLAMKYVNAPSDYDHLARLKEWASTEADP